MDERFNNEVAGFLTIAREYKKLILTKSSSSINNNNEKELNADMEMLERYIAKQILEDSGVVILEMNK